MVMFPAILAHPSTVANGAGGDVYQNLWNLWWIKYALFNGKNIFYTNLIFWPLGANLVYQTMSPIAALISLPFQSISTVFAFNVLFFLSFMLCGLTMFLLADHIVKNKYAAFIAGLAFSFSAFHIASAFGELDLSNLEWVPLAFLFFLMIAEESTKHNKKPLLLSSLGLGVSLMLVAFMSTPEMLVITFDMLLAVLAYYMISKEHRRSVLNLKFWSGIAIAIAVMLVTGAWGFIPIAHTLFSGSSSGAINYLNAVQNNEVWSDDLLSFFLPSFYNGIFNTLSLSYFKIYAPDLGQRVSYISYTVLLLSAYAVYKKKKGTALWLTLGVLFGWLSLGPYLQFNGQLTSFPELFLLYHHIPLLNIVREPARFDLVLTIATSMLAAIGVKELLDKEGTISHKPEAHQSGKNTIFSKQFLIVGIIFLLFIVENNAFQTNALLTSYTSSHISVPKLYYELKNVTGNFSILQLPALPIQTSSSPELYPGMEEYFASVSGKPTIGGYVTRGNTTMQLSVYNIPLAVQSTLLAEGVKSSYPSPVTQNLGNETLMTLFNYQAGFVVILKNAYNSSQLNTLLQYTTSIFGAPVYVGNKTIAYDTANATRANLFKSYVAYPYLLSWTPETVPINGSAQIVWVPITGNSEQGVITVYAPYRTNSSLSKALAGYTGTINTTIRFEAFTNSGNAKVYIAKQYGSGYQNIAQANVTSVPRYYTANATLISGPQGNTLLFYLPQNYTLGGGVVYFDNITFSKA
ncbi:MAG: hypothetical protein ACP5NE_02290 [Candidatus Micrarchaeia archaeon]